MKRAWAVVVLLVSASLPASAAAVDDPPTEGKKVLRRVAPETGAVTFAAAEAGGVLFVDDPRAEPAQRALRFLGRFGEPFGMSAAEREAPGSVLRLARVDRDLADKTHVRLDQVHRGLEVLGAQLVVHMDERGITGVSGYFVPGVDVPTVPGVSAERAAEVAGPDAAGTKLAVYRVGLVEGEPGRTALAWAVETGREQVWVDAFAGAVLRRIPLHHHAKDRVIYSPQYVPEYPELFALRKEGGPPSIPPVNNLYDFAGQTFDLMWNAVRSDSYDRAGITMRSVYLVNEVCPNAYWDGLSTNYCPGFDLDDVVGHEWGHAYTDFTDNLIYLCQPGALNESYSDILGEVVDLINGVDGIGGANNAQPYPAGQRWLVGEDLTERVHRLLLRDMWDPARLNQPDRVSSGHYECGEGDNGGVHTNSGVSNHAFAMLTDGKTFRGRTVAPIGLTKAFHIYYQAKAFHQTPVSKFADHDLALRTACQELLGVNLNDLLTGAPSGQVITQNDCDQVATAMLAVEMSRVPRCGFRPVLGKNPPAACAGATTVFSEDFETGLDGWTLSSTGSALHWPGYLWEARGGLPQGRAGAAAFAVNAAEGSCRAGRRDISGRFAMDSPAISVPTDGALGLRFDHFVETQRDYDGGNVLLSVNGGEFALVPQQSYVYNAPNKQLVGPLPGPFNNRNTNPKAGEFAWTGTDGGEVTGSWGTTVADLSGLAAPGDTIRLRFDFGVNCAGGITGWFVDDVRLLSCPVQAAASFRRSPSGGLETEDGTV